MSAFIPRTESHAGQLQTRLMLLGAIMAIILISGCASARVQGDSDPWKYNANTAYPAVGGPQWRL
jgi:hypothetical protein